MHKIEQSRGILVKVLGPLLKTGLPLIGNLFKPLAKNVLIPLGLKTAASASDTAIHENMFGSGRPSDLASWRNILIFSNEEMNDILKRIKSPEESELLIKTFSKTIKNEAKEQKEGFLGMLWDILSASLLKNPLRGKGTIRAGEGTVRAA